MAEKISLRKQKKFQARQKILLAAAQQFETQGFANTSIADIMQAANLGVGTFYNYFRSKEDVLLTLAKNLREDMEEKIAAMTRQAEDLKAALQKAKAQQTESAPRAVKRAEKGVDERRRRVLLGKHATKTITADSGTLVVEAGAEVTEEVLQRARLSNKFIELSMNVQ